MQQASASRSVRTVLSLKGSGAEEVLLEVVNRSCHSHNNLSAFLTHCLREGSKVFLACIEQGLFPA